MDSIFTVKPPAKKKRSGWGAVVNSVYIVITIGVGFYVLFFGGMMFQLWRHANPGPFDRKKMEAIVEEVRHSQMKPGEQREFKLNASFDPKSLAPLDPKKPPLYGSSTGHVSARLSSDGKLMVVIETNDYGHAGSFGFAYSDVPLNPKPSFNYPKTKLLDVPSQLNEVRKKIDDHWWEVQYSLG